MKAAIWIITLAVALVSAAAATATSPKTAPCPSASVVNAELKPTHPAKTPTSTVTAFSKTCTYSASGGLPIKVTFQVDTASTFAAGEKAVSGVVKVNGLGQAAWTTKVGGDLEVYNKGETIKILAPLVSAARLEALAHKIV